MAKPITIGKYKFKTKKAAIGEIRRRINSYEIGQILNADDKDFFEELFKLHDEYEEKIGCGIDYIKVESDFKNNRSLHIYRVDGASTDISWVHCVRPLPQKTVVSYAFRRAVKERIIAFKEDCLSKSERCICPITKKELNHENSEVTYSGKSFDTLLTDFLELNGATFESVELTDPQPSDSDHRGIITDVKLLESWLSYHRENAELQLTYNHK